MAYPQFWITDEIPARVITVKGRSAIDPDCLVGNVEGLLKPIWVIDDGAKTKDCYVCGLGGDVRARMANPPEPIVSLLAPNRHDAYR